MHALSFFISYCYSEACWEKEKEVFLPRECSAFCERWAVATNHMSTYTKCSIEWLHKDLMRCNSSFWQTNCLQCSLLPWKQSESWIVTHILGNFSNAEELQSSVYIHFTSWFNNLNFALQKNKPRNSNTETKTLWKCNIFLNLKLV